MKLISFQIERFRNILESGAIPIDDSITCLIGKNESGKTNLLHALHVIKPAPVNRAFDEQQYPRWLLRTDQRSGVFEKTTPLCAWFEFTDEEWQELESKFGRDVLISKEWIYEVNYANEAFFDVNIDESRACRALAARYEVEIAETTLENLLTALEDLAGQTVSDENGVEGPSDQASKAAEALNAAKSLYPVSVRESICGELKALLPTFFYFDHYSELKGRTEIGPLIEALRTGTESSLKQDQRTALSLLQLGYASADLVNEDYEKRSSEMEAVAADLTQMVQRFWHQNRFLRLNIDIESEEYEDGENTRVRRFLQLRVEDTRHSYSNNLDVRSSGFRWFVSFIAAFGNFSQSPVVLLLDEPALTLHARAQKDFLDFMEEALSGRHQVIYTTHSPFMVDPAHLERVRVVEDLGPEEGTVVRTQLMSRDPDTLSPLQGALGYEIAQNIFAGPDNLVVEGIADYTYLTVLSEVLRSLGRTALSERWQILPAGGAGSMPAAVALMSQQLDVSVVIHGGIRPHAKLVNLVDEGFLDMSRIILLSKIAKRKEADIEDLFDPKDYLNLYNSATGSSVTLAALGKGTDRIVARISKKIADFNHNVPSNWLLANREAAAATFSGVTLQRFEDVIIAINSTLQPVGESVGNEGRHTAD